ncbi:methylmalonyl Co-A mutase-associated GTPase MeaB [Oceanicella actignis]|uniref:LAO/AO transport system kinase n=1 Tax=Oceanicella actignis TaxID=1189325 RepID=A0A1M7TA30_9RHOB|nr:methylmalonyl Co-A mutase-associated GTPase MeaB [Oceanicella actignis]TYO89161.1 LAO/AO transport system kinase [Oceanicella actignis]SET51638.1 LAO/AO transport system kinase [Oceanicella actignis]SHN67537.1 LAO/AO transport system kinase [Oceanicella actignis]
MTEPRPTADSEALADELASRLEAGDRRALARAITLVESTRADHRRAALALVSRLYPKAGSAMRIGLSGTPGVGKSTFIESFGMMLVERGLKVAVLAVDPSSARTGGSILGDKTRMERLSRRPEAFIRPSPSRAELGGVARRTRETILLCEAAGFDVVLVETVGVGQSETMVADMTDIFALLLAPGGGDELQGVKRGIMEICDLILVNKADGDLRAAAERTRADYAGALRLMRRRPQDPEGFPKAMAVSALRADGLAEVWAEMTALFEWRRSAGVLEARRREQAVGWMWQEIRAGLFERFASSPRVSARMPGLEREVAEGRLPPEVAATAALDLFGAATPGG